MAFNCRYMVRVLSYLLDSHRKFPYTSDANAASMAEWEIKVWCNILCRLIHIDFIELFIGIATLAIRAFMDGDLDSDNT